MSQFPQQPPAAQVQVVVQQADRRGTAGLVSFILGVIGLCFFCVPFVGIPIASLGLLFGALGLLLALLRGGVGIGWAIAGVVVSGLGFLPLLGVIGFVGMSATARQAARDSETRLNAKNGLGPAVITPADSGPEKIDAATQPDLVTKPVVQSVTIASPPLVAKPVEKTPEKPAVAYRTWSAADGKFTVDAVFAGQVGDKVTLRKPDGKIVSVPIDKLSDEDREFLRNRSGGP